MCCGRHRPGGGGEGGGGAQREETEEHRKAVSVERLVRGEHWPAQTDDLTVAYRSSGGVQRRQSRRYAPHPFRRRLPGGHNVDLEL